MIQTPHIFGLILLDKPAGLGSTRCVARVKRLLPRGTKIGHAGTLDTFATGLLILMIGRATKCCESIMGQPKIYEAAIKLGATTPTLDPDSPEVPTPNAQPQSPEKIHSVLATMTGEVLQKPPAYSALKIGGRRSSDLVRAGQIIEPQPRRVRIDNIELLSFDWPAVQIRVGCGRGTYVRSIARDLGDALQTAGYLTALRRTRIGDHDIADAVTLEQLERAGNVLSYLK